MSFICNCETGVNTSIFIVNTQYLITHNGRHDKCFFVKKYGIIKINHDCIILTTKKLYDVNNFWSIKK